jgi:hypothetical protein
VSRQNQQCSACHEPDHKRTTCPRLYTCKAPPQELARWSETHALRQAVWEQLSLRFPVPAVTLFERVTQEWGDVGERRLWRALEWNRIRRRVAKRVIETDMGPVVGYVRRAA